MKPTLLLLAAGMGSRYGGLKQLDGLGPNGETIMDYSIYDAIKAGFGKIVFVIRKDFEQEFRDKVLSKYEGHVPAELCFQSLDALPEGFSCPDGRVKPWGTNHAVLMAKDVINEPFCVINCDDFYNRDAYMVMGKFLSELPEGSKNAYAMVGFRVGNTLSENGTVARGICSTDESGNLTFAAGSVTANADEFEVAVTVSYEDFDSLTTVYSFTTAKPMLDKNYSAVVKSADANAATVTVGITYAGFAEGADVTVDGLDAAAYDVTVAGDTATVTLEGKELLKLDAGVYDVTFIVDGYALGYKLDISGTVGLYDFKISEGVYELFTADQVRQLSATAGSFENVTFVMTSDIDLGGSVIAPISNFKGVLDGSGYTISGYTIESMVGNNAAFIAVNDGTVRNLVLDGSVNVSIAGRTGNDYAIAGLAAVNNGTVTDVTVKGSVKAASTSLSAFIDIDAALVVAIDNSDATVADGEGSVAVTVSFDLVNVTVRVGALDSTTADDGVTMSVDCINGRSNPIFTNDIIAG